jgi:hypothetical protein
VCLWGFVETPTLAAKEHMLSWLANLKHNAHGFPTTRWEVWKSILRGRVVVVLGWQGIEVGDFLVWV